MDDENREVEYYKRIAKRAGELRLRETEKLWQTIALKEEVERELEQARDELEQRVATRTAELVAANERLQTDAEERKQVMAQLAESEAKYRAMFDDSLEAMMLTREGVILDVNPAWLNLFAYSAKQEVLGKLLGETLIFDEVDQLSVDAMLIPSQDMRLHAMRGKKCDRTMLEMEVYSTRISIGGRIGVLTTIRDVTEKKRMEKEKESLENRLRQSEKLEAIGTLAGGVAHDLNNILGGIIIYPELMLLDLPESSPLRQTVLDIKKSGEKAASIVKDLLALARRGVKVSTVLNFNQLIRDYLSSPEYKRLLSFHEKVEVKQQLEKQLKHTKGSPVHLYQVVMNLVSNAAEAISGAGTVTLSTENRILSAVEAEKFAMEAGEYIVFKVTDTGIGISDEERERIFEPFFTKKVMGRSGTGLGMTVVLGTVQDHGGHIEIESAVGRGTEISVWLSATNEENAESKTGKGIAAWLGNGESILVVDDVAEQRAIASEMLSRLGYHVTTASSGEEATAYLTNHRVDLVLIDMIMDPGIDGYETYRRILELHPRQKAIVVSGYSESVRVQMTMDLGARRYLSKPYAMAEIGEAVRDVLSQA